MDSANMHVVDCMTRKRKFVTCVCAKAYSFFVCFVGN